MATTYTTNLRFQKPAATDRNWDVPLNTNADQLDSLAPLGQLAVTAAEVPSTTCNLRVSAGSYARADGTFGSFAGTPSFTVPASATTFLWLTDSGTLTSGAAFPTTAHVRLARVTTNATSITNIVDQRIAYSTQGTGLGFVLKAGDTLTGPLAVAATGAPPAVFSADPVQASIGFFGTTPTTQAAKVTPLVDATSGVVSDTITNVSPSFSQTVLNNNFASLTAKVDALIAALKRHGLMAS